MFYTFYDYLGVQEYQGTTLNKKKGREKTFIQDEN